MYHPFPILKHDIMYRNNKWVMIPSFQQKVFRWQRARESCVWTNGISFTFYVLVITCLFSRGISLSLHYFSDLHGPALSDLTGKNFGPTPTEQKVINCLLVCEIKIAYHDLDGWRHLQFIEDVNREARTWLGSADVASGILQALHWEIQPRAPQGVDNCHLLYVT